MMLLSVMSASAGYYKTEIAAKTQELIKNSKTDYEKYYAINDFTHNFNNYKFSYKPISLSTYWKTKTGDCTEVAKLRQEMYKTANIKSRLVHGYVNDAKHDYIEAYIDKKWISVESENKMKIMMVGKGIW